jgi:hypothetical protein
VPQRALSLALTYVVSMLRQKPAVFEAGHYLAVTVIAGATGGFTAPTCRPTVTLWPFLSVDAQSAPTQVIDFCATNEHFAPQELGTLVTLGSA